MKQKINRDKIHVRFNSFPFFLPLFFDAVRKLTGRNNSGRNNDFSFLLVLIKLLINNDIKELTSKVISFKRINCIV